MRLIAVLMMLFLLTSCIYTEATPVIEPKDVVVSPKVYRFGPWAQCDIVDVTDSGPNES